MPVWLLRPMSPYLSKREWLIVGTEQSKVETMKRILTIMLNGDPMYVPNSLMLLSTNGLKEDWFFTLFPLQTYPRAILLVLKPTLIWNCVQADPSYAHHQIWYGLSSSCTILPPAKCDEGVRSLVDVFHAMPPCSFRRYRC